MIKNIIIFITIIVCVMVFFNKKDDKICMTSGLCFEKIQGTYNWHDAARQCNAKGMILPDENIYSDLSKDKETLSKLNKVLDELYNKETKDDSLYGKDQRNIFRKYSSHWTSEEVSSDDAFAYMVYDKFTVGSVIEKEAELSVICVKK